MNNEPRIAYFSMEIAIKSDIPTYSGGLGVLAGDLIRSAADLEIPMVAVALTYSGGYFYQVIDHDGLQYEKELRWEFTDEFMKCPVPKTAVIEVYGKPLKIECWRYNIVGNTGFSIPIYLLESNVEGNEEWMKSLTHTLYDANRPEIRLIQEMILGMGGVRILDLHGLNKISCYHMNEGHAAFVTLELLRKFKGNIQKVRDRCLFTTHTPVPAGFDVFNYELVRDVFRDQLPENIEKFAGNNALNMAHLAANLSGYINAVSKKHQEVSQLLFSQKEIDYITNGINTDRWVSPYMRAIYDKTFPGWLHRPEKLKNIFALNSVELWTAHQRAKLDLLDYEKSHSHVLLDSKLLTIGWGRRITGYKRPTLIFKDRDRLGRFAQGKVQFIFAGKTHPRDDWGKHLIREIQDASEYLWKMYKVRVAFLENYDIDLAKLLISGSDLWLNTPRCGLEASGTSGMKAALNGVPTLSSLDGWWLEGIEMEAHSGFSFAKEAKGSQCVTDDESDANEIYELLEKEIIPMYYERRNKWIERMKNSIKLASHFNTHRMVKEYATKAWQMVEQPRWRSEKYKWMEAIK
ncbi:MAG: alpha-glucan family phosphorylase [Candidatus Helarchaeota archaeon]